ncbi:hypothetical protein [Mycolicibacterium mengxianglii]|uniref:hypothetical protein n=1 Tax=Mycolicibacterium mengxianglii TaxID=2736649 RepID=UPI0018D14E72|nr:hypothetical protein [Mycolicibacterium mengxianglii]
MARGQNDDADPAHVPVVAGRDAPTVLCPQGHVNGWNYRFCGKCGTPIGVVAWPDAEPEPTSFGQPPRNRKLLVIGLAVVAVVAVAVGTGVFFFARSVEDGPPGSFGRWETQAGAPTTSAGPPVCPSAPDVQAESIDLTQDGLEVQAAFLSPCGVDVESNGSLVVTVAEGKRDVAAASFDFSHNPLLLERGVPARRTLVFPHGMYWRTPDMLSSAPTLVATREGKSSASVKSAGSGSSAMVATKGAKPAYGSVDGVAAAVLEEIRDGDLPDVRRLTHAWVPQVSSKKVGLTAAGKTWANADILQEHLEYRQRFPGTRLVWSGQWTTFSAPDFWVTVVGPPHYFPDDANRWCDTEGFAVDDCFAKFISAVFGVPGTTVYRK